MNILLLTFAYLPSTGGVQRSVRNLAAELAHRGHRVAIVTDATWSGIEPAGLHRGTPVDVLALRIPTCFHWSWRNRLRSRCRDLFNLMRLAIFCRRRNIQVVHSHLINVDTRYGAMLKKLLGVKFIITLRGDELSTWIEGRPHRLKYVQSMLRSADAVTSLSQAQADAALALEPAVPQPISVIPNPVLVDMIRSSVDPATSLPQRPYIVSVGRLVEFKSLDTLIAAYHRVIASQPSFAADLVLVGGGELEQPLRRQAASGAGAGRIHFAGACTWGESLRFIQAAQCLVLPSQDSEGCPNVLLEAMALDVAPIVSDFPTLPEMVTDRLNGAVFPRRDAAALQACLEHVCQDDDARERYVREGRLYLQRRHQPQSVLAAYERLYAAISALQQH